MADFQEISQGYAQGAIKAVILINGGAAIAVLSQAAELAGKGLVREVGSALIVWTIGVGCGAASWLFGFLAARYRDKGERERIAKHVNTSNAFMAVGLLATVLSLVLFLAGCLSLAVGFGRLSAA